jgi:hypothetical protein
MIHLHKIKFFLNKQQECSKKLADLLSEKDKGKSDALDRVTDPLAEFYSQLEDSKNFLQSMGRDDLESEWIVDLPDEEGYIVI